MLLILIICFFHLFLNDVFAQKVDTNPDKIIARIGDLTLTRSEFINRWELSPQVGRESGGPMTESRKNLFYSLVGEKLLALRAIEQGLDTTWLFRRQMKSMEEIWVRDQLYKADIESKVVITPKMISTALTRASVFLKVKYLYSQSKDSLDALRVLIMAGTPFDSILAHRYEHINQNEPLEITYGVLEKDVEDIVFTLKKGEITRPVKRSNGYFIFYCVDLGNYPPISERELKAHNRKIQDMVHIRESDWYYQEFMRSFFKGKKVVTDGQIGKSLSKKLTDRLTHLFSKLNTNKSEKPLGLPAEQYKEIEAEFGSDSLEMVFIKYDSYPVTLKEFLYDLQFRGFGVTTGTRAGITNAFFSTVELMARDAALNAEGYQRGYQNNPEVKSYMEGHRLNTLAEKVKGRTFGKVSVSDKEVSSEQERLLNKVTDSIAVNALEIQTKSLETCQIILAELSSGASFSSLADQYNENGILSGQKHETGFFVPSQRPLVGKSLSELETGSVFGPVQQDKIFSVFKLIEKKKIVFGNSRTLNTEKPSFSDVKAKLWERKYTEAISEIAVGTAKKYGLEMDEKSLDSIFLTPVNMASFQEMGFGGKIMAAPYTSEFTEWVTNWKKSETPAP